MNRFLIGLFVFLLSTVSVCSVLATDSYNYISAAAVQKRLTGGPEMILVDICPAEQFSKGHIPGAIETNAYPVKTDEEKARLAKVLPTIQASTDDVVIVCPGGGGGARNTFDYLKSRGVAQERLLILEKGMNNWPYGTQSR